MLIVPLKQGNNVREEEKDELKHLIGPISHTMSPH